MQPPRRNTVTATQGSEAALLLSAVHYAAEHHRLQRRKGPGEGPSSLKTPYINHPIRVAQALAEAGIHEVDVLCAAILHDTIEDTLATEEDLRQHFGDRITGLVLEVTDDKSLPKAERKRLQVEHASVVSQAASWVKLADKIENLRDILDDWPEGWSIERVREYFDWARRVVTALREPHPGLMKVFEGLYAQKP